jgi:RND family efflux transporter MFP subunit
MVLRLALLTAVFCVGCGTAVLDAPSNKADAPEKTESAPKKEEGEKKEDEVQGHVTVRCVPAQKRALAVTVDGLGRTEPLPEGLGSLTATVEGHVHKLLVKLGDFVTAEQPIVELDTTVARTALAEKLANRDSLKAALALLVSPPRPEECRAAELAIEQAEAGVEHAQAVVERLRPLVSRREVSPQQFSDAEHTLKTDRLLRDTATAQLKLLKLGPRPQAVAEAQTKIAIAEQGVANARALLYLHTLRAPISGSVDSLNCHPGQTLTVGTPVGEIVDRRRVLVTVYLPTRSARNVQAGLPVRIELVDGEKRDASAGTSDELSGQVAFVGAVADPQTGSFPARILVNNADGRLRIGEVVKAIVKLRTEQAAIAVPQAAIYDQGEGPLLAVVRDGKIKQLHPELGAAEGGLVVVTKTDLHEGEMVVTDGAYNVPEGTEATISKSPLVEQGKETETAKTGDPPKAGEHE